MILLSELLKTTPLPLKSEFLITLVPDSYPDSDQAITPSQGILNLSLRGGRGIHTTLRE